MKRLSLNFILCLFFQAPLLAYAPTKVGLISIPVNGTHLAHKCLELLLEPFGGWDPPKQKMGGQHQEGNKQNIAFFKDRGYKIIFMIRDPRDRVVSYAYKIKKFNPRLNRSIEDLMLATMKEYGRTTYQYISKTRQYKRMGDFSQYYSLYLPWLDYPELLVVYFENLVGPKAGGSLELQLAEIEKIANFLELTVTDEQIMNVADNLFGGTFSFRDPKIGRWKEFFNENHKKAFKATKMGQFLIDFGYAQDLEW